MAEENRTPDKKIGEIAHAEEQAKRTTGQRWSHFLRQRAKVDSPMQRTTHHEDAETVFG
jgi:hypothetical protein